MKSTYTAYSTAVNIATGACLNADLHSVGDHLWSRTVSDPSSRTVWLLARVVPSDERIDLRWETARGNVIQEMVLPINFRTAALLTAIASATVNAEVFA